MIDWLRWPRPRFELVDEPKSREEVPPPYPMCLTPKRCAQLGYCPREIACND